MNDTQSSDLATRIGGIEPPPAPVPPRNKLIGADELRQTKLPTQSFGGYKQGEVEDLVSRAADSIAGLTKGIEALEKERDAARAETTATQEVVTQTLVSAQRLVETIKEDAVREAAALVERAHAETEQAAQLNTEARSAVEATHLEAATVLAAAQREAESLLTRARTEAAAAVEDARAEADAVRSAAALEAAGITAAALAEAETVTATAQQDAETLISTAQAKADGLTGAAHDEHERLIADAARDSQAAREALAAQLQQADQAIADLRSTWSERIGSALARLDAADAALEAWRTTDEQAAPDAPAEAAITDDLNQRVNEQVEAPAPADGEIGESA